MKLRSFCFLALAVSCAQELGPICPNIIDVVSKETLVAGRYVKSSVRENRPVFKAQSGDMYLYYFGSDKKWYFSKNRVDGKSNSHYLESEVDCPTNLFSNKTWYDWKVDKWAPEKSTIVRAPICPTSLDVTSEEPLVAGHYYEVDKRFGRPIFLMRDGDMFLYYMDHLKKWLFSKKHYNGLSSSHRIDSEALCPTSEFIPGPWFDWKVNKWVQENSTKIKAPVCPNGLVVTSNESLVAGNYIKVDEQDSRPVYTKENSDMMLYYIEKDEKWYFSRGNTEGRGNSHKSADLLKAMCPTEYHMADGTWFDWKVDKWAPETSTVIEEFVSEWADFGDWSGCSRTCKGENSSGRSMRVRHCLNSDRNPVDPGFCKGENYQYRDCNQDIACPQWGEWGEPGECSVTCGEGKRNRERECFDNQNNLVDDKECHAGPDGIGAFGQVECENFDCPHWGSWDEPQCSVNCGGGLMQQKRRCVGKGCKGIRKKNFENQVCNTSTCGTWTTWVEWTCVIEARFKECQSGSCLFF